jgi:hypothetical protein
MTERIASKHWTARPTAPMLSEIGSMSRFVEQGVLHLKVSRHEHKILPGQALAQPSPRRAMHYLGDIWS